MKNRYVHRIKWVAFLFIAACASLLLPVAAQPAAAQSTWYPATGVSLGEWLGIEELTAGGGHVYMRTANGQTWVWGDNRMRELGFSVSTSNYPRYNEGLMGLKDISAGLHHGLAINGEDEVYAWGDNSYYQSGYGPTLVYFPKAVYLSADYSSILSGAKAVAAGGKHSLALSLDGRTIWAWGENDYGQLGIGTASEEYQFPESAALNNTLVKTAIAAGYQHSLALDSNGHVWAWGADTEGQLGRNSTGLNPMPKMVVIDANETPLSGIQAIYTHPAGSSSYALAEDGTVYAWGSNTSGQLGTGDSTNRFVATPIHGLSNIIALAPGAEHVLALREDGVVLSWGKNEYMMLGRHTETELEKFTPAPVEGLNQKVISISAGAGFSFAIGQDNSIWGWGANDEGQLGNMTYDHAHAPQSPETMDFRPILGMDPYMKEELIDDERNLVVGEMLQFSSLYLENFFLSSLSGLEYAKNLTNLTVNSTRIRDITPIASLAGLNYLNLADNNLEFVSLEPLGHLTELEELDLSNTGVHDGSGLSALANLEKLTDLYLDDNLLETIPTLPQSLTELQVNNNRLKDISSLASLTNLEYLSLGSNELESIGALENLTKLFSLSIHSNQFTDLTPLKINVQRSGRTTFGYLDISNNLFSRNDPLIGEIKPYISYSFYNSTYYNMNIYVRDSNGTPIEGATVQADRQSPDGAEFTPISKTTNASGEAYFDLDYRGIYSLTANVPGYQASTYTLDPKRSNYHFINFTLVPEAAVQNVISYFVQGDDRSMHYDAVATYLDGSRLVKEHVRTIMERRTDGTFVRLPELDWSDPERVYDITLFGEQALLQTKASFNDRGQAAKMLELPPLELALDIQSVGSFSGGDYVALAVLDDSGQIRATGYVGERARIQEGIYNIQFVGYISDDIHHLEKEGWLAEAEPDRAGVARAVFTAEDVVTVKAELESEHEIENGLYRPTPTYLRWDGVNIYSSRLDQGRPHTETNMDRLFITKGTYPYLGFIFTAEEYPESGMEIPWSSWSYEYALEPAVLSSPEQTVTFSTYLEAVIPRERYAAGEMLFRNDLFIKDKYGHTVTSVTYEDDQTYETHYVKGLVTFTNEQQVSRSVEFDLLYPWIQMPTTAGTYTMEFAMDGGALPIIPAKRTIEVVGTGEPGHPVELRLEMRRGDSGAIRIGDSFGTVVEAVYANGDRFTVTDKISFIYDSEALALTHSASGTFTALKSGSHVIRANYNGITATYTVYVLSPGEWLKYDYMSQHNRMDLAEFMSYVNENQARIDWSVIRKEELSDMLRLLPAHFLPSPSLY
jgi:alpha-tubulin suppressor-like RCC1 family protein